MFCNAAHQPETRSAHIVESLPCRKAAPTFTLANEMEAWHITIPLSTYLWRLSQFLTTGDSHDPV